MFVPMRHYYPTLFLSIILLKNVVFVAAQTNRTVDDSLGDSVTGAKISYRPPHVNNIPVWRSSSSCSGCAITPDTSQSFDNTWTAAEYEPVFEGMSATFSFYIGTAIYIYLIQPNYPTSSGLESSTICQFYIDADVVGYYQHVTDGSSVFQYNVLAYSNTSVVDGSHTFVIKTNGQNTSYVIFDYAIYTTGSSTTSSAPSASTSTSSSRSTSKSKKTPTGAIVGGVIGGIAVIALVALALARCRRRDHIQHTSFVPFMGGREENGEGGRGLAGDAPGPPMTDIQHQITERRDAVHKLEQRRTGNGPDVRQEVDEIRAQIQRLESQQQSMWGSFNNESPGPSVASDSGLRMNSQSGLLELPPSYVAV